MKLFITFGIGLIHSIYAASQTFVPQGPAPLNGPIYTPLPPAPTGASVNQNGAIQAFVINPMNSQNIYIGAASGGIWSTSDFGSSWTPLLDHQLNLSIAALAFDPADTTFQTLVAGTGITTSGANQVPTPSGLYYTTNGGSSWSSLGAATFSGQAIGDILVNGPSMLVGVNNAEDGPPFAGGLYVSTNTGASFTPVSTGGPNELAPGPISSMKRDLENSNTIYAAVSSVGPDPFENTALFKSLDHGSTWQPIFGEAESNNYITSGDQSTIKVATGPSDSVAVLVQQVSPGPGVAPLVAYLSLDGGSTWNNLDLTSIQDDIGATYSKSSIAIDVTDPKIVYITGSTTSQYPGASPGTVYRLNYSNSATTITSLTLGSDHSATHADTRMCLSLPSGGLIVSSDGGIALRTNARSNSAKGAWNGMNGQNLSTTEIYSSAYDGNNHWIMTSSQDNGTCIQSVENQPAYSQVFPGDGFVSLINDQTSNESSVYYFTMNDESYPFKTLSSDIHNYFAFLFSASPTAFSSILNSTNSMFLNRNDPRWMAVIYNDVNAHLNVGTGEDLGFAPTLVSAGVFTGIGPLAYGAQDNLQALVYCATSQGLYFTPNAQTTPLSVLSAFPNTSPSGVVFDPRTYERFFVTDSTSIYETTDAGSHFSGALPGVPTNISPINTLEFISNNGVNALLIGGYSTDPTKGTVASANCDSMGNLGSWTQFGLNLPNTYVIELTYNTKADLLLAGLWGRGAWTMYDVTSNFLTATTLQFGLANNDSTPDASILTGNRPLNKFGTGTLTVSGTPSFTGLSTIYEGTVVVNGSILGGVSAQSGGTLRGTGSIGGTVTILADATLAPGNSPGLLSMGALDLQAGSLTEIQLEPSLSSEIMVSGTATLAGELLVIQKSGVYTTPATYTILTAGNAITTRFDSFSYSSPYSGFAFHLEYLLDSVSLTLQSHIPTENLKGNNLRYANYINGPGFDSSAMNVLKYVPESSRIKAVNAASPTRNAISSFTSAKTTFSLGNTLQNRRAEAKFNQKSQVISNGDLFNGEERSLLAFVGTRIPAGSLVEGTRKDESNDLWLNVFADLAHQNTQRQVPTFHFRTVGFLLGYDHYFESGWVGAATGYANISIHQKHGLGEGTISSFALTPYGTIQFGKGYCELFLMGVYNRIDQKRHISFPGFDETACSNFHNWQLMPHVGFGYDYTSRRLTLEPYVGFDFLTTWQPAFQEHNCPAFAIDQKRKTSFFLQSEAGLRFYQRWDGDYGVCILREIAAYVNQLPFGVGTVNGALAGNSSSFILYSFDQVQNLFKFGLSAIIKGTNGTFCSLVIDGEVGSGYISCEPQIKIGQEF